MVKKKEATQKAPEKDKIDKDYIPREMIIEKEEEEIAEKERLERV